ncbi:1-deoxy-D-xylulose-5-phosphate synthase [Dermatophilus congolensis]|uniref:1-deoxy-D-xylulose-5-phosphate synthase n=1 Tax=Dermatophilus congolensis TaxID=1863 RepID=A0A239VK43_9MICO|nr:1-deoxy-D-xylulose-5-phosphate synthase [Dermatophilus congolensis]MBO3129333.1 1-deoxy-D-xylulose-5-phosphate synthase [Dermatophilus congolensis]MBO3132034.1 1-deoxy-D-xylulose-5-phosphate synthase [Dermatophilus congolensis]MBO3133810.1 1-deoxy-D-xylulose-5-phosphate synthase [Dermatophilus congolensis]MBO3136041.1 1-deoxy-D-xylulose-5-phosphate synthase [Dermatophilus congolensis]MBO3138283.1 1-deoxy-D-xylulose-5-phosphate synthase [Dermatophilus congolensis]
MSLLEQVSGPEVVRSMTTHELDTLAGEIRSFLVDSVSRTGGHLGPNLGVVELTLAIHRVFESPKDSIVFDTGHISYVHKLLTGRQDFTNLRKRGGLSGYPSRAESVHDIVENSHASGSLSWASGIARARKLAKETGRHTVAVIGDGALTGGMAWEALNEIAADDSLPLVIVVNDNERSYAPTTGGLAQHLAMLRTEPGYEEMLSWGRRTLNTHPVGRTVYETLHGVKKGLKDIVAPQVMFEDLGLKYVGPIDGHDVEAISRALRHARDFGGPVLVHAITEKGHGYEPALADTDDAFHAVGVINPETGLPLEISGRSWTDNFAEELVKVGQDRKDVVAITAAMLIPVGLREFAAAYPDRVFDVGIAEQHAIANASGLAFGGMHPVVAIYSTFLNRAFDQVLMDAALHKAGMTIVLDRAGATGSDGASHNGMWDLSALSIVPGIRVAAPRDGATLRAEFRESVAISDGPSAIRFPKGSEPAEVPAVGRLGDMDVLFASSEQLTAQDTPVDLVIVSVGAMAPVAIEAGRRMAQEGLSVIVVDPRWVLPVSQDVVALCSRSTRVAVIEDGLAATGIGAAVASALHDADLEIPVTRFGLPKEFLEHASRGEVLTDAGLTVEAVVERLHKRCAVVCPDRSA